MTKADKAEPNINPDTQVKDSSQEKGTLKLATEVKEAIQVNQNDQPLYLKENMTEEEKDQKGQEVGYIPTKDFKGDPNRHMTRDEFLIASEKKMPALKNQIRKQDAIIKSLLTINKSQYEQNEEQQKTLGHQMQEASDEQDLVKFRNLEKQETALEKRQEALQANLVNLENNRQEDSYSSQQENIAHEAKKWAIENTWYNDPQTQDDLNNRKFADQRFNELSAKYPNAEPLMIFNQITADLNKSNQSTSSSYSYNPGGGNPPMGQPLPKDKTESNLTEGGLRMLRNVQAVARSDDEKKRLTKSYLNSSTNDNLFKWYKNN